MGVLFSKLLGVFWKRGQAPSSGSPHVPLTPERIAERLHPRPRMDPSPKAFSQIDKARVVVVADDLSKSEIVFAVVDKEGDAHRLLEVHQMEAESHAGSVVDIAGPDTIDTWAPTINIEPDPILIAVEEIDEAIKADEPSATAVPAVERPQAQIAPRAVAPADTLVEVDAQMRREAPDTEAAAPNVLKILGFDKSDLISSLSMELAPTPVGQGGAISLLSEPASIIETPSELEVAVERVVVDDAGYAANKELSPGSWKHQTVGEVLLDGECSVRLVNRIAANENFFSGWTIGRALANRSEFAAALMQVQNLGRKTANETLDALEAFALDPRCKAEAPIESAGPVAVDPLSAFEPASLDAALRQVLESRHTSVRLSNLLATGDLDNLTIRHILLDPDEVRTRMMGCKNAGRKTVAEAFEILAAHVEELGRPDCGSASVQTKDEPPKDLTTRQWIEQQMAALPPNRVEVLHDRYGLDGKSSKTLQEIARRVHVTRERVRQVEAGAIKRLRKDGQSRAAFTRYLVEAKESQWAILFGSQSSIPEDEISERFRRLDPWFLLAIDIVYEDGRDGYLNANAHKAAKAWFKNSDEAESRQKFDHIMSHVLYAYRTPMPLDTLKEVAPAIPAFVSGEAYRWSVHDGYICSGYVGTKARRTVRMHAIARRIGQSGIFDIGTLIAKYRALFPEDDCGSRMFEMQANEARHLFAPLFDSIWLCLDRTDLRVDRLFAPPFERGCVDEDHFTDGSLGDLLVKRLRQFGPERLVDLQTNVADSANGFLLQNPCFRRVAPGIFGLYSGTIEVSPYLDEHLLEERHCRVYCHARHSGAPQDYYPMWGSAYEMRLSAWAQRYASPDLYHSLLSVIEPESWPASVETAAEFQALKSHDGDWLIGSSRRRPLGHRFLDSQQFFSTLTHLIVFDWISWISVNRTTGTIGTSQLAADVLAFFVMTGLVEPESDWQSRHRPTDVARRLFLESRWERHLHGDEGSGNENVFSRLRSALYDAPPVASQGWVDIEEFTRAMAAWQSDEIGMGKAFGGGQGRTPNLNAEESFESNDWDAIFGA